MNKDEIFIRRCLELAICAEGRTSPNPMVGSVIVYENKIIGEGFHTAYGKAHAEPEAIKSVINKDLLPHSTIYVSLEPCSHYGKMPPCTDIIIKSGIKKVIIAAEDPNPKVGGNGIQKLIDAGIDVKTGVLRDEAIELNKFFYTFHTKHRPYIILKWAESSDGYIDIIRGNEFPSAKISSPITNIYNHRLRTKTDAILVGTNTVIMDNPQLTSRYWKGTNPRRITVDMNGKLNNKSAIFNETSDNILFTSQHRDLPSKVKQILIRDNIENEIISNLYQDNIQSVIIEGGAQIIKTHSQYWIIFFFVYKTTYCQ